LSSRITVNFRVHERQEDEQMEISRKPPTAEGPAETFTGEVWLDPITRGLPPSGLNVSAVHFAPGARTAWHSHDGGQTLYVTGDRRSSNSIPVTSSSRLTAKSTGTAPAQGTS
jgi:hypothetical protein